MRAKTWYLLPLFIYCCLALPHQAFAQLKTPQLMLWVKAEDLSTLKDGERVGRWPDASGQDRDLVASPEERPIYKADALHGRPAVVFENDKKAQPPVKHSLQMPLRGEWRGVTVFAVGRGLQHVGWFQSNEGGYGNLRMLGWIQLTSTKAAIDRAFPDFAAEATAPQIATIRTGMNAEGAMQLETFANGKPQGKGVDTAPNWGITWSPEKSRFGTESWQGAIAELIVYQGVLSDAQREQVEKYLSAKYGLADDAAAPKTPWGYTPPTKTSKPATKQTPVTTQPVRDGLKVWLRADEIKADDKALVAEVPNANGGEAAVSENAHRPRLVQDALNGRGVLRFENAPKTPGEEIQRLKLPASIQGEHSEFTLVMAGRSFLGHGLFDTAPGSAQTLRHIGALQLIGSRELTIEKPFPWFQFKQHGVVTALRDEGQIVTVTVGKLGATGQYIATYADGQMQARGENAATIKPVLFRNAQIGGQHFNGDIGEVLFYDRALTDAERVQTEKYLSQKWGVPIRDAKEIARLESARSRWSLTVPQLPNTQSWFANTFAGPSKDGWVQSGIFDVTALPDGRIAAISVWDEPHKEIGFYKDGKVAGGIKAGGGAITMDGKYIYAAMSGYGKPFTGVRRLTLDGQDAGWPDLPTTDFGGWGKLQAIRFDTPKPWNEVRGIAVGNGELFVTAVGLDEIRVYDVASGAFKRSLAVKGAGKLAVDNKSRVWAALDDELVCLAGDGKVLSSIKNVVAGGLAFDKAGTLWVADNGQRQQLIAYDISGATPRETKTFGDKGGVFSGPRPGQLTDSRIIPPKGLAIDDAGNFIVLGTNVIRAYAPSGRVLYTLECTSFTNCADFDPASDGNVIYTGKERYDYVPGAPPGRDWKLSGITVDHRRFPEFAAGSNQPILRSIGGNLLMYSPGDPTIVHRREPNSDIFVPAAIVVRPHEGGFHPSVQRPKAAPQQGRFAWSDANGNGLIEEGEFSLPKPDAARSQPSYNVWIDSEGGIWEPQDREGMRYLPLQKLTPQGAPVYDLTKEQWIAKPSEFIQVQRVVYLPRTDTMILTGNTWDHPALGTEHWGQAGREIVCYSDWNKPTRRVLWRTPFPEGATNFKALTVAPAANIFFAGEMETMTVFAYDLKTGKLLGMVEPDKNLVGDTGWIDIDSGIRAFTRSNGEVLLLSEEVWGQKQMVYRIKPLATR